MSSQTIDNFIFEKALDTPVVEKPILKRSWLWIPDTNNAGIYSQNQVEFLTNGWAANGSLMCYSEAILSFPLCIVVTKDGGAQWVDIASDAFLALKNSHINIIHSASLDYANGNVTQPVPYLNHLVNFRYNSELSEQDEENFGDVLGYAKDSTTAYRYNSAAGQAGIGLCNNINASGVAPVSDLAGVGDISNRAITRRQSSLMRLDNGKNLLLMAEAGYNRMTGNNVIINHDANRKVIYYDCTVRLRDVYSFIDKLPPVRGAVMKFTLVLNNNISFTVNKANTGFLSVVGNAFNNVSGLTNPIMFCANSFQATYPEFNVTNDVLLAPFTANFGAGSAALPAANYTVSTSLCRHPTDANIQHAKTQCRLYVPSVILSPVHEKLYFSNPQRNIEYLEYEYFNFRVQGAPAGGMTPFSPVLTPSTARMIRLVIVAQLTAAGNAGAIHQMSSPFSDSNPCPFVIQNFNVQIAGNNIYPNQLMYSYEQFLHEMNSQQGINGGLTDGLCSGRISKTDYENNMKYIVVDLSRRLPEDENVGVALQVTGNLLSLREVEFFCYIEKARNCVVDVSTGKRI